MTGGWGYQEWRAPKPRAYDYGPQGKYLFILIIVSLVSQKRVLIIQKLSFCFYKGFSE